MLYEHITLYKLNGDRHHQMFVAIVSDLHQKLPQISLLVVTFTI